ncbi:hypothetical protein FLJC2902T_04870 [Flavobacterium limnosediminis JC2902]|uniref:Glycosyltransferase 2-like domain-containing protein n=1 Tax=Flavobacterium limnosediminis JC2902 TaxID=1341181 RepID=V6SZZ9_9FLAO|nr:hypothetical protein FLJC2902T_04870 [Flavobacterium limnosediminis JC2902]
MIQNFSDFEYIIVDGNSTDKTVTIIKSFEPEFAAKNITFKFISEKDKGIYDAWNKGVAMADGKWISFLGSDDCYFPDALITYFEKISQLQNNENYISSQVHVVDENGNVMRTMGKAYQWKNMLKNMNIAQVGSFHKRELFQEIGPFSLEYRIVSDLDFYIRGKDYIKPYYFKEVTATMENNGVSNQINKALKEALKVRLKYNYDSKLTIYLNHYITFLKCYGGKIKKGAK